MDQVLKDILDNSDKAEILEVLSEVLEVKGCRVAIITGVPKADGGLDITVNQVGHKYMYELLGFLHEGMDILEGTIGDGDET